MGLKRKPGESKCSDFGVVRSEATHSVEAGGHDSCMTGVTAKFFAQL